MISKAQKIRCLKRELALRQRVYARFVTQGRMTDLDAAHEIAVMAAILKDYEDPEAMAVEVAA